MNGMTGMKAWSHVAYSGTSSGILHVLCIILCAYTTTTRCIFSYYRFRFYSHEAAAGTHEP
jgi:hypothetical protein